MPFNQRLKIFEAIKGSTIHQSLATPSSEVRRGVVRCNVGHILLLLYNTHQVAMNRCQSSIVTDPTQTMELLRVILQQEINAKIQNILNTYIGEWHKFPVMKYIWRV